MTNKFQTNQMHHIYCIWLGSEPNLTDLKMHFTELPHSSVVLLIFAKLELETNTNLSVLGQVNKVGYFSHNIWFLNLQSLDLKGFDSPDQLFIDLNFFRGKRTISFHAQASLGSFRPRVTTLVELLQKKLIEYWRNNPTQTYLSTRWISNLTRNLAFLAHHSATIPSGWQTPEKPVLLLGAGPGLWSFRHKIQELLVTHYVLALDTCLPMLAHWGLEPHGILIVESQYWNTLDFIPLGNQFFTHFSGDVFLDLTSNPQILRGWEKARPRYFLSQFADATFLKSISQLITTIPPLGNIGCIGLYLVRLLKFQKATLIGLDFSIAQQDSMTSGGHHHLWYLHHLDRFTSLPFSNLKTASTQTNEMVVSMLHKRDYEILEQIAHSSGIEIEYLSILRSSWKLSKTAEKKFEQNSSQIDFGIDSRQIVEWLKKQVITAKIHLGSGQSEEMSEQSLSYFSTQGSFLTLNVPGSIHLSDPERPQTIHGYANLGIKRMVFEIERGLQGFDTSEEDSMEGP